MVKADAYGHGLLPVARALEGADGLAVARLQEALALRSAGIKNRIVLMSTLLDAAALAVCSEREIDVTAHDEVAVSSILSEAMGKPLRVWLELDSGMHRTGLDPDAFVAADRRLAGNPRVLELIHMTHFSSAGPKSITMDEQLARFWACHAASSDAVVSLANSAALLTRADTHADWVRPGLMLYGINPLPSEGSWPLRAAMTLRARVIAVREIGTGESVGYSEGWRSARPSYIATVGIGYGDGYPRHTPSGTPVWIHGQLAPLVGHVSMDSLTVDATDCEHVVVGDEVTLWGPGLPAATIAECAKTIAYELLASIQPRVSREYTESEQGSVLRGDGRLNGCDLPETKGVPLEQIQAELGFE
jgi:alanine racemase